MRPTTIPALLALLATLAACESAKDSAAPGAPTAVTGGESSQSPSGADLIARYAVRAAPGDSAQLQLPEGGQVFVTVGSMYTSAAGIRCQRITVRTQRDASRVSAVCQQDGSWHTVLKP